MPRPTAISGGLSAAATSDRFRTAMLACVQEPQLRRTAVILLAAGEDALRMLMGTALVLPMTPGRAFFRGGFTGARNVLSTILVCIVLLGIHGAGGELGDAPLGEGFAISASSPALFEGMFAIITLALISGALVERINVKAWFWFSLLLSLFVYCPMAKVVWGCGDLRPFGVIGGSGAAAGLVGITPAAGDTFMAHGGGGTAGALISGILGSKALVPADCFPKSAELLGSGGNLTLFISHVKAVLISYGFVGIATAAILWMVILFFDLRVSPQEEERGLDFTAHGEEAHDPMTH